MLALWPDVDPAVLDSGGLTVDAADSMVENVVGTLSLPMGLGLNFIINGEPLEASRPSPSGPSPLTSDCVLARRRSRWRSRSRR